MAPCLIIAAALVAGSPICATDNLVPYAMRKSCCRSLPYYGIAPGCGTPVPGPAFDYRTEFDYPWFHEQYRAAAAQAQWEHDVYQGSLGRRAPGAPRRLPVATEPARTVTRAPHLPSPRR
ncbi:MAG: hypothetical protein K1X74_05740 [Pirellulales bacterium]|nr:hypothetical protein [Pirellulales bacterium]